MTHLSGDARTVTPTPVDQPPESGWRADDGQGSADRYRPIPLREFVEADVQRQRWAVEGIWAEGASGFIAGPPKSGKSTLVQELAITLATGTPFLALEQFPLRVPAARVTYIQAENSGERVRRDFDLILEARGLGYMEPVYPLHDPEGEPEGDRFRPAWTDWEPDLAILSHPGMDLMREEDREWFWAHAIERDYVFLDPIYLLASANPNDMSQVMSLLGFLSGVRDNCDCGLILTHQLTDKHAEGSAAARLLGSTFFHGWYETAIFTQRSRDGFFSMRVDNLREMGDEREVGVKGCGVGHWFYAESAQGATDSEGRSSPQKVGKGTRVALLRDLRAEHGDRWTNERYAEELGVSERTVQRYLDDLNTEG